jgi:8-oxo-dGTP pyrophosphatase MutT (NUDIX family)
MSAQKYKVFINDNVIYLDEKSFTDFCSRFTVVQAAGGLVKNNSGEYLFIFRRGRWDLPKGKKEGDETPEETALREVQEECGLSDLKISRQLPSTYHSFPEKGKNILKHTHWFLMETKQTKVMLQTEEDIEDYRWLTKKEIFPFVQGIMYTSLIDMLKEIESFI